MLIGRTFVSCHFHKVLGPTTGVAYQHRNDRSITAQLSSFYPPPSSPFTLPLLIFTMRPICPIPPIPCKSLGNIEDVGDWRIWRV